MSFASSFPLLSCLDDGHDSWSSKSDFVSIRDTATSYTCQSMKAEGLRHWCLRGIVVDLWTWTYVGRAHFCVSKSLLEFSVVSSPTLPALDLFVIFFPV
jgi:hypothetical protein